MTHEETAMEDYKSPTAAKMMDVAFGLNGMARWIATEAEREEQLERDRIRQRQAYERGQARIRQQRHRDNSRIIAQTQSSAVADSDDAA